MKKLTFDSKTGLFLSEASKPQVKNPDDVLVKIAYASICSFDIMTIRGDATQGTDGSIGHEASGVVEAVGEGVSPLVAAPGDRVTLEFRRACGVCDNCRKGYPHYCVDYKGKNEYMSEYVVVSQKQVYRLPDHVSLKQGCLAEPLVMAVQAARRANLSVGKTLLILGAGAMGLIILKLAKQYPLSKIIVAEPNKEKQRLAKKFGADIIIDPEKENILETVLKNTSGQGYDAVIEVSGNKHNAKTAFQMVTRGGSLVFFGLYGMDFEVPMNLFQLYWKDISIHAVAVPSNLFLQAIELLSILKIEEVITGLYPFSDAVRAFKQKESGVHAKVMLEIACLE